MNGFTWHRRGTHADSAAPFNGPEMLRPEPRGGGSASRSARAKVRSRGLSAVAVRAVAFGACAIGALSAGAVVIGSLAIGALAVKRGRVRSLTIEELDVRCVRLGQVVEDGIHQRDDPPVERRSAAQADGEDANSRLVRQAYQCVKAGDMAALLGLLAEDVEWQVPQMEKVPFAGTWHGREQVEQFFSTVARAQDAVEFEPEGFIAQDDKVVVLGRFSWRVKSTGRLSVSAWAHVWTINNGRVTQLREYVDTAAVMSAYTGGVGR